MHLQLNENALWCYKNITLVFSVILYNKVLSNININIS